MKITSTATKPAWASGTATSVRPHCKRSNGLSGSATTRTLTGGSLASKPCRAASLTLAVVDRNSSRHVGHGSFDFPQGTAIRLFEVLDPLPQILAVRRQVEHELGELLDRSPGH